MILTFLPCPISRPSIVDQASVLTHTLTHYSWDVLLVFSRCLVSVLCTMYLCQMVYAQLLCLLRDMPILFLTHLSSSEHRINLESPFYQFGISRNLDPSKPSVMSWINMHYLHLWTRVCNQHEVQIYHSERFLEVPSKTLGHSSTVPSLHDSVLILFDVLHTEHIPSFHVNLQFYKSLEFLPLH